MATRFRWACDWPGTNFDCLFTRASVPSFATGTSSIRSAKVLLNAKTPVVSAFLRATWVPLPAAFFAGFTSAGFFSVLAVFSETFCFGFSGSTGVSSFSSLRGLGCTGSGISGSFLTRVTSLSGILTTSTDRSMIGRATMGMIVPSVTLKNKHNRSVFRKCRSLSTSMFQGMVIGRKRIGAISRSTTNSSWRRSSRA